MPPSRVQLFRSTHLSLMLNFGILSFFASIFTGGSITCTLFIIWFVCRLIIPRNSFTLYGVMTFCVFSNSKIGASPCPIRLNICSTPCNNSCSWFSIFICICLASSAWKNGSVRIREWFFFDFFFVHKKFSTFSLLNTHSCSSISIVSIWDFSFDSFSPFCLSVWNRKVWRLLFSLRIFFTYQCHPESIVLIHSTFPLRSWVRWHSWTMRNSLLPASRNTT